MTEEQPRKLSRNETHDLSMIIKDRTKVLRAHAEEQAAAANGAKYIPTSQWMCAQLCVPIVGHIRVYNNQFHISATYAKYLSGAVQSALGLGGTL